MVCVRHTLPQGGMTMQQMLYIESRTPGLLSINGFFCGPIEGDGQSFPMGLNVDIYIQFFPYARSAQVLSVAMRVEGGQITRLEPQDAAYALLWPDGIIQLELTPGAADDTQTAQDTGAQGASSMTLLRYLSAKLAGDMQADALLMRPQDGADVSGYDAVVPLRFAPGGASERYDERAGLVRRLAPNIAKVDAALACTVPAGQGRRMIERVEIVRT